MAQRKEGKRKGWGSEPPLPRAQKEGLLATDVGEEIIVYDPREHRGHCLNPPAAVVWRHLDGRTTMSGMVQHLRDELDAPAGEDAVWLALEEFNRNRLLEQPLDKAAEREVSRRSVLRGGVAAASVAVLLPAISTVVAPPAYAQVSGIACETVDTCQTFSCPGGCACVPTTEGTTVCIVPTCVAPCTTSADCPPGTVCFTLGCCGPATYCVPLATPGQNCAT